jgi:NADH dehydrogenase
MPETVGQCYELCGNERLSYEELLDAVAAAMGRQAPFKPHLPLGIMQRIIPVMQQLPQFPITSDQLQMLLEESICDGSWKDTFRFEPREFGDGIREYIGKRA